MILLFLMVNNQCIKNDTPPEGKPFLMESSIYLAILAELLWKFRKIQILRFLSWTARCKMRVYITHIDCCVNGTGDTPDYCKHGPRAPILWGVNWIIPSGTWLADTQLTHRTTLANTLSFILNFTRFPQALKIVTLLALLTRTLLCSKTCHYGAALDLSLR